MRRIALPVLAGVLVLAAGSAIQSHPQGAASPGSPHAEKVEHVKAPPGPRVAPAASRTSATPKGLPPESAHAKGRAKGHEIVDEKRFPAADPEENEEIENGENSKGDSNYPLVYHRGTVVQTTPRVYLVLWGANWNTTSGDPYGVAGRLHYMYQGLGGSSWANVLKQYGSDFGSFSNVTGQYRGWIQDTGSVPARPTTAQIEAVVQRAANRIGDYSYNAQYVVAMPWGVVDQYSLAKSFCAWHSWKTVSTTAWATYTALPYIPYMDVIMPGGCGGGKVNGANGLLDGVTMNAGHEYAESVNNPGLNAWYDAQHSENADKCSWVNPQNRTLANGYAFPMQSTWSNVWKAQFGWGCYYS